MNHQEFIDACSPCMSPLLSFGDSRDNVNECIHAASIALEKQVAGAQRSAALL
jgi:hypothetical protein